MLKSRDSAPGVSALMLGTHSSCTNKPKHLAYAVAAAPALPEHEPAEALSADPPARFECYRVWVERHVGEAVRLLDTLVPFTSRNHEFVRLFRVGCGEANRRVGVTAKCAVYVEGSNGGAWSHADVFASPCSDLVLDNPAMCAWWRAVWGRVCEALGVVYLEDGTGRVAHDQLAPAPVCPWCFLKELHALAERSGLLSF